jgi:mortality factor 4-like protein 1
MAPSKQEKAPPYSKDEKVLCFHGDLMYEAKIMEVKIEPGKKAEDAQYRIHYKGWKASWDDWVTHDRIRKLTEDNKQLAAQLQAQARMRAPGPKGGAKKTGAKAAGSEISSARGSEERAAASTSFAGRGPRRGRDYELETVSFFFPFSFCVCVCVCESVPLVLLGVTTMDRVAERKSGVWHVQGW